MLPILRDLLARARNSPGQALLVAGLLMAVVGVPLVFSPRLFDDFTLPKQSTLLLSSALIVSGLAIDGRFLPSQPLLRVAIIAWAGWLTLAWLTGTDPRGSLLGHYQYRQGYLTQISYVLLFLGTLSLARRGAPAWLLPAALVGLGGALVYTIVQAAGQDPIDWWLNTSDRAIGTIGNANELSAYAIVALSLAGVSTRFGGRSATAVVAIVSAGAGFIVFETESRSGLAALGLAVALYPLAGLIQRLPRRTIALHSVALASGALFALSLSLLADVAEERPTHSDSGAIQHVRSTTTRAALWRGTLSTIAESPLTGFGPDGLPLAFPLYRPADLGGAFEDYDLVAQSSHNLLLDTAANTGLPGLVALLFLLGVIALSSIRRGAGARDEASAFTWSALLAYCAITLLNPISLAAHALFFVILGLLAARTEPPGTARSPARSRAALRLVMAAPVGLGLAWIALALPIADRRANLGWDAHAVHQFELAGRRYHSASRLMPIERTYLRREAEAWLAAGARGDRDSLLLAERRYEELDDRFGLAYTDAMALAAALIGLDRPDPEITAMIELALALNPHGVAMAEYMEDLRQAVLNGGRLIYSDTDGWVFVEPNEPEPDH